MKENQNTRPPRPIVLADPKRIDCDRYSVSRSIHQTLEKLSTHQCVDLEDLAELLVNEMPDPGLAKGTVIQLGVDKYDIYDEYFGVDRATGNPKHLLALATIKTTLELGRDAAQGTSIDPFATQLFLRSIKIQAKLLLEDSYYD